MQVAIVVITALLGCLVWRWQQIYKTKHDVFAKATDALAAMWELQRDGLNCTGEKIEMELRAIIVEKHTKITSAELLVDQYFSDETAKKFHEIAFKYFKKHERKLDEIKWNIDIKEILKRLQNELRLKNIIKETFSF